MATILTHITDVGSSDGVGSDSTKRIQEQYRRVGYRVEVITPGRTPLEVAFYEASEVQGVARERANQVRDLLGLPSISELPIALNSAPRNGNGKVHNGKEDFIYYVVLPDGKERILYGPELLSWLLLFHGHTEGTSSTTRIKIQKVLSVGTNTRHTNIIPDTSCGSQFRSAEHLPLVHAILARKSLERFAHLEEVLPGAIFPKSLEVSQCIVLPSDEFGNGRIGVHRELFERISQQQTVHLMNREVAIHNSLTTVTPGVISIWPSSNHLPNPDLVVLNFGTRWDAGGFSSSNPAITLLQGELRKYLGSYQEIQ